MNSSDIVGELLRRSHCSKSEFSAKAKVSRALLDDYLKGRRQPSVAQLARLGEAVGFEIDFAWRRAGGDPASQRTSRPVTSARALTIAERAKALEAACADAMTSPVSARDELMFPPFLPSVAP